MTDERDILKQYSYKATSNLVIEQQRRRRKDADSAGVAALQAGSLPGRMGDKIIHERPHPADEDRTKQPPSDDPTPKSQPSNDPDAPYQSISIANLTSTAADVVDAADELAVDGDTAAYTPSNAVSQRAFEALLAFIASKLGDQPRDLLRSAATETLALLKDNTIIQLDRKKQVETILGAMQLDEFTRLSLLGRQISDYDHNVMRKSSDIDTDPLQQHAAQDVGVAVVYDPEDEDALNGAQQDEKTDQVVELDPEMDPFSLTPTVADQFADDTLGITDAALSRTVVDPLSVDAHWIHRQLTPFYPDALECQSISEKVFDALSSPMDERDCENALVKLLQFDKFDVLTMLLENREVVVYCIRMARAKTIEEKSLLLKEMEGSESGRRIAQVFSKSSHMSDAKGMAQDGQGIGETSNTNDAAVPTRASKVKKEEESLFSRRRPKFSLRSIDLDSLSFQRGGRLLTVRDCKLPEGSEQLEHKDFEEWHIPATRVTDSNMTDLIEVSELPEWAQRAFPGTTELNRVQSTVFPCAFETDENMLLCAPTGAGKTNVALLTILRALRAVASNDDDALTNNSVDLKSLKVVYVAPMKALVSEVVENLGRRLSLLGLQVRELTGDVSLSRHDLAETHVIVTTPEKWDIVTRKSHEKGFIRLVRLLIVDEIHLLHDERGPVLESIVARTLRDVEAFAATTRVVGLSATLPNYKDVATFLRVKASGLFYFGPAFRPCPLQQCFVGITAKKALKRFQLMNEITYDKVKSQLQTSKQVIVFVHSRKETVSTGQFMIDKAIEDEVIDMFLKPGSGSAEIIQSELSGVKSKELASLLEHGVGVHHAGMTRSDRQLVEALFDDHHIKVLVSTATLAWGVNLPAHAVIIKGTQVYSPEHGRWTQLSSLDVMQMMGRAGRPQHDKIGEGIIVTTKADVLYYLSLLNNQLPIESQFVSRLVDMLNAEVANGSVASINDGSHWLSYLYLYVRMLKNPMLYGIAADEHQADPSAERRRAELVHSAATQLHKYGLVRYNRKTGELQATNVGRIAADFYVNHASMAVYLERMKECSSDIDLLRVFSVSGEFQYMRVREEEKLELSRISERVPIPLKEALEEPSAKVNVLLQAYISNLSLDGLALRADMVYVTQSAGRLARALFHIAVDMKNANLVDKCLTLCKSVSCRQWSTQTPLRQFERTLGRDVVHKIERKDYPFERYYDLKVAELGELLKNSKLGKTVHRLVHSLPRIEMDAQVRPISRSTIEVKLTLFPDFRFDRNFHGGGVQFWVTVEDADSEHLLHVQPFYLRSSGTSTEHILVFTLPFTTPLPPQYFIRCRSDEWFVPETVLPILFHNMLLPDKFAPHSQLQDDQVLPVVKAFKYIRETGEGEEDVHELARKEALADAREYFLSISNEFSPMQSQMLPILFGSDDDTVVASIPDIERQACIDLCIARLFVMTPTSVAVVIAGRGEVAINGVCHQLRSGIARAMHLTVGKFSSDKSDAVGLLRTSGSIVVSTPEEWDKFSRRWREKKVGKVLKKIGLIVFDNIHLIASSKFSGAALEVVASRMRYIAVETKENGERPFRLVAISDPVANARELGHWLGCPPPAVFSFHPKDIVKDFKLEVVTTTSSESRDYQVSLLTRPVYLAMRKHIVKKHHQVLVFMSSRKAARLLALELATLSTNGEHADHFLGPGDTGEMKAFASVANQSLAACVKAGVAFLHDGLVEADKAIVEDMYRKNTLRVLITTAQDAWRMKGLSCHLVIIGGTKREDNGVTRSSLTTEYSRTDVTKMIFAARNAENTRGKFVAVIFTSPSTAQYYRTLCLDPLAIESQLPGSLPDHLNAEVASGVIESKQDAVDYLTWTFFYRRLPKNASFYGMKGVSPLDISNHLSELVERALSDLEESKCVATEGDEDIALGSLNLGMIASHYYLRHATVEYFSSSISGSTGLRRLLDILSMASEFETIAVRSGEEEVLKNMALDARVALEESGGPPSFSSTHVKAHLLLQAQMSRQTLPWQLAEDRDKAIVIAVQLLRAMVDVIWSAGWLKPATAAIELSQMLVQGVWDNDPELMQLPHVDRKKAEMLREQYDVNDIFDFSQMSEEDRAEVLQGLSAEQVAEIANACQQFPNLKDIEIEQVEESVDEQGVSTTRMVVLVKRYEEEDEEGGGNTGSGKKGKVPRVVAPRYADIKEEGWWVIVGDESNNRIYSVKHVALKKESTVKLEFASPETPGQHTLKVLLMSDSYLECDQDDTFEIVVSTAASQNGTEQIEE